MSAMTTNMLRPQTMMSAILPSDLLVASVLVCPTSGIPHSGLIPTGAEDGSAENPLSVAFEAF